MDKKYYDLNTMLSQDTNANAFYATLPSYVQEMISERGDNIHTVDSLRQYADNLLSGDK